MTDLASNETNHQDATESGKKKKSLRSRLVGWAFGILILILYITYNNLFVARNELATASAALESTQATQASLLSIISAPGSRAVTLNAVDGEAPALQAYWAPGAGLVLLGEGLPSLEFAHTLQLWVIPEDGTPTRAATFEPEYSDGSVTLITQEVPSVQGAVTLAVSDEPSGGSEAPTTEFLWRSQPGG